jgi:hypothetical protein
MAIAAFSFMIGLITKLAISKTKSLNKLRRIDRKTWRKANQKMRMQMKLNHRIQLDSLLPVAFAIKISIAQ